MATTTFCDWCGERLELDPAQTMPFGLNAGGEGENGEFWLNFKFGFHVHVGDTVWGRDKEPDPDSCFGQLMAVLNERKSWAHDPEQKGAEWRLVDRQGRLVGPQLSPRRQRQNTEQRESERRLTEQRERMARKRAWRETTFPERREVVTELLAEGPATVSELCARMSEALPECGELYDGQIRPLLKKLVDEGHIDRDGEKWRGGNSVRFRYFLPDANGIGMRED